MSAMEFLLGWIVVSTATALVARPWFDQRQRIPVVVRSTERPIPPDPVAGR